MSELIKKMSMQDYLASPGLSSTALGYASESMQKYKAYIDGRIGLEGRHIDLGNAVHKFLESEESFFEHYVIRPDGMDRRTKAGKEAYAEFEANAGGKTILDSSDWYAVRRIIENFESSNDRLLNIASRSRGTNEVSVFWNYEGLACKCRADRLIRLSDEDADWIERNYPSLFDTSSYEITICVDYKTTSKSASRNSFLYAIRDYHYGIKAAHYLAGTNADAFLWIVMETNEPFHVTRYLMSRDSMERYANLRSHLIQRIIECEEKGVWPGIELSEEDTLI